MRLNYQPTDRERIATLEAEVADLRRELTRRTGWMLRGSGSPEGAVTAPVGTLYLRTDLSPSLWIKQTGTGNTGWVAK